VWAYVVGPKKLKALELRHLEIGGRGSDSLETRPSPHVLPCRISSF